MCSTTSLKGASHEQLQLLRHELERLNTTVLRARRSGSALRSISSSVDRGDAAVSAELETQGEVQSKQTASSHALEGQRASSEQQRRHGGAAGAGSPLAPPAAGMQPRRSCLATITAQCDQQAPSEAAKASTAEAAASGTTTAAAAALHGSSDSRRQQCHHKMQEAAQQLHLLQAENRELRSHLGQAESSVSDLRQQLINLQLTIDRTGGVDAGQLLLQNQKLQRALHAKEQAVAAAHTALMAQSARSGDERVAALQARLREAQAQLHARDAALSQAEAQLRDLRARPDQGELGHQRHRRHPGVPGGVTSYASDKTGEGGLSSSSSVASSDQDDEEAEEGTRSQRGRAGEEQPGVLLKRERERVAALQAALAGSQADLEAKSSEVVALQQQVVTLQRQQQELLRASEAQSSGGGSGAARGGSGAGLPTLEEALQQLARRAQEISVLREEARRAGERRAEALAEQEAAFERRLQVQQRMLESAQAEVGFRDFMSGHGVSLVVAWWLFRSWLCGVACLSWVPG